MHSSIVASLACSPNSPAELKGNGMLYSPLINWAQRPINESFSITTNRKMYPGDIDYNPYGTYPNDASCAWRLTVETGHVCRKRSFNIQLNVHLETDHVRKIRSCTQALTCHLFCRWSFWTSSKYQLKEYLKPVSMTAWKFTMDLTPPIPGFIHCVVVVKLINVVLTLGNEILYENEFSKLK